MKEALLVLAYFWAVPIPAGCLIWTAELLYCEWHWPFYFAVAAFFVGISWQAFGTALAYYMT